MKSFGTSDICPYSFARAALKHQDTPLGQAIKRATDGRFDEAPLTGGASSVGVTLIMNFDQRLRVLASSPHEHDRELLRRARQLPRRVKPT